MKLSNDQKKILRAFMIYPICYIPVTILYHMVKGNIDWSDILWQSLSVIVVSMIVAIFLIIGSKTPEK